MLMHASVRDSYSCLSFLVVCVFCDITMEGKNIETNWLSSRDRGNKMPAACSAVHSTSSIMFCANPETSC